MNPEDLTAVVKRVTAMDVGGMMRRGASFHREKVFLVYNDRRLTFGEVLDRTDRLSVGLTQHCGIRKGERVAMLLQNRPEFIETYWAVVQLGAVIVPVNFRLTIKEIAYILNNAGVRVLIAQPNFAPMYDELRHSVPSLETILTVAGEDAETNSYEALINNASGAPALPYIDECDPCSLLYTAGTTGFPKGAVRTHKAVMWYSLLGTHRLGPDDAYLAVPPLFHIGGHELWIMNAAMQGAKIVLLERFDPLQVLTVIQHERITVAFIPPAIGIGMLQAMQGGAWDLSSLRSWLSASAPLPAKVRDEATTRLPSMRFSNGLGMTEAGGIAFLQGHEVLRKPSTCVGFPSPTVDIRIVDANDADVAPGQPGEIILRSPQIIEEYWDNPTATAEAMRNGWFHGGDAGAFDEDGHLHVLDRIKDMVITGGENVHAAEVENVLFHMPEVLEAAIIGIPDEKWGEAVTAVVAPKPGHSLTEAELIARCRNEIAHYKCPRRVIFVEALPRNAMGKVLKYELRERYGGTGSHVPESTVALKQ